jgi:hypothetical protein
MSTAIAKINFHIELFIALVAEKSDLVIFNIDYDCAKLDPLFMSR